MSVDFVLFYTCQFFMVIVTFLPLPFLTLSLYPVAALHQGAPGQMTWLEDPPP